MQNYYISATSEILTFEAKGFVSRVTGLQHSPQTVHRYREDFGITRLISNDDIPVSLFTLYMCTTTVRRTARLILHTGVTIPHAPLASLLSYIIIIINTMVHIGILLYHNVVYMLVDKV